MLMDMMEISCGNTTLELRKYHAGLFKKNTFAYRVVGGIMTDSTKEGQKILGRWRKHT